MFKDKASNALIMNLMGRLSNGSRSVPIYERHSPATLTKYVDGSAQTQWFDDGIPVIDNDESFFVLEPASENFFNYNMQVQKNVWQKGSNIFVTPDNALAPDNTTTADQVSVALQTGGNMDTNIIKRSVKLKPGTKHYLSFWMKLIGGSFAGDDVMRVRGAVAGSEQVTYLAPLNQQRGNYRLVELPFTVAGDYPSELDEDNDAVPAGDDATGEGYPVTEVTASTVKLDVDAPYLEGGLKGAEVVLKKYDHDAGDVTDEQTYTVVDNVTNESGELLLTLDTTSVVSDGVDNTYSGELKAPDDVQVDVEFLITATVTFVWGGIQLEEKPFRTSTIFLGEEFRTRADTQLFFRPIDNPLYELSTAGVLIDLKYWRGDGNILDAGNLSLDIQDGKLHVTAGNTEFTSSEALSDSPLIFLQVSEESAQFSIYLDRKLVFRTGLGTFTFDYSAMIFSSDGVRAFSHVLAFNTAFTDGNIEVGQMAKGEVGELLRDRGFTIPEITSTMPSFVTPPIYIPEPTKPAARSKIISVDSSSALVTVEDGNGFSIDDPVTVEREDGEESFSILYANVTAKSGSTITLDSAVGIVTGDFLASTIVERPGKASIRYPFTAADRQEILSVDSGSNSVNVETVASFTPNHRAIVQTPRYIDVAEPIVLETDSSTNTLFLDTDTINNIKPGDFISQIEERGEVTIDPSVAYISPIQKTEGLKIHSVGMNGFIVENWNDEPIRDQRFEVTVYL